MIFSQRCDYLNKIRGDIPFLEMDTFYFISF